MLKFSGATLLLLVCAAHGIVGGILDDDEHAGLSEVLEKLQDEDGPLTGILPLASSKCNIKYACDEGKPYYIETANKLSRDDAWRYCKSINMELLIIENCAENAFITNVLKEDANCAAQNYWTAGYQTGNSVWYWDDTTLMTYTNWKLGEPDAKKKDEFCVHIRYNFLQWNNAACNTKYYFICEGNKGNNCNSRGSYVIRDDN